MDNFLSALFGAIFTLLLQHFYGRNKENKRLKKTTPILKSFIETSVITSLERMIEKYEILKENIREGVVVKGSLPSSSFPWLNSKVFEYFDKKDLISILSKKEVYLPSIMHVRLIELDYISDRGPNIISEKFRNEIFEHFLTKEIFNKEEQLEHYFNCNSIEIVVYGYLNNIDIRIEKCKESLSFFNDVVNKHI